MDDNEAIWRMNEFARALHRIERDLETFQEIIRTIEGSGMLPEQQWKVIHPLTQALKITIRKEPERVTHYEQLTMKEIMSRVQFRNPCHDALCTNPRHCSECGLHGVRSGDSHDCIPPDLPE